MELPKRGHHFFHHYSNTSDISSEVSNNDDKVSDEATPTQPKPPEVFVCQFDGDYSPNTLYNSVPKHATMVPTDRDLLQVPTKVNTNSTYSFVSSKYMTPYASVNSLLTNHSLGSSQESIDMDYDMGITGTRKKLLHSRRKSLSENNIAALCRAPSLNFRRNSSGSATISESYQIKVANDIYKLCLPKPLKNKMTQYNSYLAISISQNMVRNKHGGSTDV